MDDDLDMFDEKVNAELDKKGIGEVALLLGILSRYSSDGEKYRNTWRNLEQRLIYLEGRIKRLRGQFDTFPKPQP